MARKDQHDRRLSDYAHALSVFKSINRLHVNGRKRYVSR